ncbi:MAG: putative baseplate assembly protein [Terracidiphilus sp.]
MIYSCCNENRKAAVLGNPTLNGIDYLEVVDREAIGESSPRQQTLLVHCLNPLAANLATGNVLITGGESVTGITAQWVAIASKLASPPATSWETTEFTGLADAANVLVIRTSAAGDFSPYVLRLVNDAAQASEDPFQVTEALSGFDPILAEVEFSFKVECPNDFDCAPAPCDCPPEAETPPPINYLAKDYGSFRSILLDRLNQLAPNWGGSAEADIGVALAEAIAYVGDFLSYQQDAVATEAYIETARSRISLRRHARLVDYFVHDGANARAWVHLRVSMQISMDHTVTRFYTFAPGMPSSLAVGANNEEAALAAGVVVFEPMQDAELFPEHNRMHFYTWGDLNCCLPKGATEATLRGTYANLQPGDVLIFEEVLGPQTGNRADADLRHRCAVRLTQVTTQNGQGQPLVDPLFEEGTGKAIISVSQQPTPVTEIQWSTDDALPFAVCISSTFVNSTGDKQTLTDVSVVLGNVVLADQGLSFTGILLGTVPEPQLTQPANAAQDRCNPNPEQNCCDTTPAQTFPVHYWPQLKDSPVTQAVLLEIAEAAVTSGIVQLVANGYVTLKDANGYASLSVEADEAWAWPQYFGVQASANLAHAGNFDLEVVYNPSGGATGQATLESFTNLSLTTTDANYAMTQINMYSKLIQVPASFTPGATPNGFPAAPIKMANTVPFELLDAHGAAYLTLQAVNPLLWPANFGVLSQGNQQQPTSFNLLVVYNPPSGGVGVQAPVVVEQFNNLTLGTVAQIFDTGSVLISAESFVDEPNLSLSAYDLMNYAASEGTPSITLTGTFDGTTTTWTPLPDLLESGPDDANFVVEVESNGVARLRFGDNTNGRFPDSGTVFSASYRIGNGTAGNVGAESLVYFAGDPRIEKCTNPLPASGGVDPETNDQICRRAPRAFMTQERAVSMADYENVAESNPQVEQAVAELRWTGSWYTVFIAAEPENAGTLTPALKKALTQTVNRYRLAGQDIQLESPQYVPLEIKLTVCVDPEYFAADVKQALLQVLGSQVQANGQPGYFAPDTFSFGETVYLSPIYAAARQVAGVTSVTATVFQPQGIATKSYLHRGEIPLGPLQIAQMDNDPSYPNHGQLTLAMKGGK